ncbi:MAG: lysylphosphatidylglycerol synthase transmembrane domain-containing protein [Kofleriaceae bacterium]
MANPRRVVTLIVAIAAVIAAFTLLGDVRAVRDRLGGFAWGTFVAALGLAVANYALRFARWQGYLRTRQLAVPAGTSALVFVAGFSMAVTPGKLGELIKSFLLRELADVPVAASASIVIAERVSDLLALLVLAVVGVAIYGVAVEVVIASAAVVAIGLAVILWRRLGVWLIELVTTPRRLAGVRPKLLEIYGGLAALAQPRVLAWSTVLSVAAWACEGLGFAIIVSGFPGASVAIGMALLIYAATTIAGALSFLPGGLGVTEGAMTLLLVEQAVGVDRGTATAATILTRLATLWFAVLLGAVALAVARRRAGPRSA